jgi:cytochrome c oxidase cbb3-type subunit 2
MSGILNQHKKIEQHATLLLVLSFLVVTIGGIVQIVPLFYLQNTIERVEGMRPYTPLEIAGREIYLREGCYVCHSQMVRPMRDEVERYGHYSLAAESMYDHPFQWGSKRTGPDLARLGGRYSDGWHVAHMINPRDVVPESIMPPYAFLLDRPLTRRDAEHVQRIMRVYRLLGHPYTDEMIAHAIDDFFLQGQDEADIAPMAARYAIPRTVNGEMQMVPATLNARNFDGQPQLTEMDAIIAYMQMLGTLVDFSTFVPDPSR